MTALETQTAQDSGSFAAFYAMMLHIDDDDLDPFEYRLLGHYRKICGLFKSETCTESIQTTATASHMSVAKVRDARKSLEAKGRIKVTGSDGRCLNVRVINCMAENLKRYSGNPYQKREGYQKRNPYQKREGSPIESDSSDLSNPIGDLRIEESEEINTDTSVDVSSLSPQNPKPISTEKPATLKKHSEPKEKGSGEKEKAVQPHVALIEAYHWALPDDVRPPGKPSISRHSEIAVALAKEGITPYDVVRYVTLTYPGYRRWAESKGAKSLMSFEHVNQYIKGTLKAMKGVIKNEPRSSNDSRPGGGDSPTGESGAGKSLSATELFPGIDDPERVARIDRLMRTVQGDGVLRDRKAG